VRRYGTGVRPMVKPIIDLMLFSSMFPLVNGIMLAGALAHLGALTSRSGTRPGSASDDLFSDDGWGLIPETFE
jgi:hypothetical protein